jgi:hypothetical protein
MAVAKFTDGQIYLGAYDLSGKHNQIDANYSADMLDATTFEQTTKINAPGLLEWSFSGSGFWETGAVPNQLVDPNVFNMLGATAIPLTLAPANVDQGVAYFMSAVQGDYKFFGPVGVLTPFSLGSSPSSNGARGVIAAPKVSRTASGNGTANNLGAPSSAQFLTAAMHVVAFNGTSLDMLIQSDDAGGFGSPTTRITFATATGVTSELKSLQGPLTDNFFRSSWTFVGTSFTAVVVVGIR